MMYFSLVSVAVAAAKVEASGSHDQLIMTIAWNAFKKNVLENALEHVMAVRWNLWLTAPCSQVPRYELVHLKTSVVRRRLYRCYTRRLIPSRWQGVTAISRMEVA
jgi:hypothetical protein